MLFRNDKYNLFLSRLFYYYINNFVFIKASFYSLCIKNEFKMYKSNFTKYMYFYYSIVCKKFGSKGFIS